MVIKKPKIAIIIVCTNEKHFLKDCLDSLAKQSVTTFKIFLVDNHSSDGSVAFVKQKYPNVGIIQNQQNLGFAEANNVGMRHVFKQAYEVCILLNPDTVADHNMIKNLLRVYVSKKEKEKIGFIQPLLLLHDQPNLINSSGNPIHFLGFGYAGNYLKNKQIIKADARVLSATGGAALVTKNFFLDTGGFDRSFFMYCEDQSMSWQGLIFGYKHYLAHNSIVYHKYKFNRNKKKLFYAERNRLIMIAENYALKTICLLLPVLIINELLMLVYALLHGWLLLKVKSYFSFCKQLKTIKAKRKLVQNKRVITDREIFCQMSCKLDFATITNHYFKIVNVAYCLYFNLIKKLI